MRRRLSILTILALWLSQGHDTNAQSVGVIWDPPTEHQRALADLEGINRTGITAIRVPTGTSAHLLQRADSLGLGIYQDLSDRFLTGSEMELVADSLLAAVQQIERAGFVTWIGLATGPQSNWPGTCEILRDLTEATSLSTYLVSWRRSPDPCANSVDEVFYDSPRHQAPDNDILGQELGTDLFGQADFFASRLAGSVSQKRIFLFRWRDQRSVDAFLSEPGGGTYGISSAGDEPRAARKIIEGILTEGRFVFERPAAAPTQPRSSRSTFVGWLVVLVLLALYVRAPRFRPMTIRYFSGHTFYRTAVVESRNTMAGSAIVLMICFGIAGGIIAMEAARVLPSIAAYHIVWNWAPDIMRAWMDAAFGGSGWWVLVLSSSLAVAGFLWVLVVYATMGRHSKLGIGQVLLLVILPQWGVLLSVPILMISAGLPIESAAPILRAVTLFAIAASWWGSIRASIDLRNVAGLGPARTALLWLLSPPALGIVLVLSFLARKPGAIGYLWYATFG